VLAWLAAALAPDAQHQGRREFKFRLSSMSERAAVALVRSRVPALRAEYAPRQVSSLYFDSASYTCYYQSNAGVSERAKVRLRWYGALAPCTPLTLELKHRANHLGWKSQYAFEDCDLSQVDLRELAGRFAEVVAPAERSVVRTLRMPILVTTYFRHYFSTADGGIRVTVDSGLRFTDQRRNRRLRLTGAGRASDLAVVECKTAPDRERDAAALLRGLPQRHGRFSKYCHALERLTEGA